MRQARLLTLAGLFLFLYSLAMTIAPAARARSWDAEYRWNHWVFFLVWVGLYTLAHYQTEKWLPARDPYLLPVTALLSGWGILTIWRLYPSFGVRQSVWLALSLLVFLLCLRLPGDLGFLRRFKYLWLTAGLLLTALTLFMGTNPLGYGPRLWLGGFGVYFQPSEPLKLLLVIYLTAYLADRQPLVPGLLSLLAPTLIMTGLVLLLLLFQRDLGTATIFLFLYAVIVYIATGRKVILLVSVLTLILAGLIGYGLFDVVRLRVDSWINPWLDPSGRSYQIVQSLMAVASGGLFGRGPGLGNPGLVPIPHSDFIFVAIAEEGGLVGAFGLFLLLGLLVSRGLQTALVAPDAYRRYLATGLTALLVSQGLLIIGGNLRLLPLTGVTFPLVSYGGTSLLTSFVCIALLLQISNRSQGQLAGQSATPFPAVGLHKPGLYLHLGGFLMGGLAAVAMTTGWWAIVRGPALLTRTDNARRAIADRYVLRGAMLDRNNIPLSSTTGTPGDYTRRYLYPALGPITGYTHPVYGQSGLEASLDSYLRGLQGNSDLSIWWNHLLYGQPPPGLDVRLTLDARLQGVADSLLGNRSGALVLLNAENGDILAMASHPTFDANGLDQAWSELVKDERAPFFNRAVLGQYPPGAALGPLFLAEAYAQQGTQAGSLAFPQSLSGLEQGTPPSIILECAIPTVTGTWEEAIAVGCPGPVAALGDILKEDVKEGSILHLLSQAFGFGDTPPVGLPAPGASPVLFEDQTGKASDPLRIVLGQVDFRVSPLQMALVAGALSRGGFRPVPRLVMAVDHPDLGWIILPDGGEPVRILDEKAVNYAVQALMVSGLPIWQSLARLPDGPGKPFTWVIAGTLPDWNGTPLALALLLEEDNPMAAKEIGQLVLKAALQP